MPSDAIVIDGCNPSNWRALEVFDNLRSGGVTAINATVNIWDSLSENIDEISRWLRLFREHEERILQVRTVADIERARNENKTGVILGWQNMSPVENDIERLEAFAALGLRIAQLAYNYRNLIANGCYERADDGLSRFGMLAVKKMNELGILIDLSHVGDHSSLDAIEASEAPVAFTHCNLREFYDTPRNKPKALVQALVERGGVIGANQFPRFLPRGFDSTLGDFLDAIESLIDVAGIDSVGVASDFCEKQDMDYWRYLRRMHGTTKMGEPEVPRPDPSVEGLRDSSDFPRVAQGLRDRGYGGEEVRKLMGGNWMRLYSQVWSG